MPRKMTQDTFIERCKKLYGDRYDYSKVKYVNNNTKICVICAEHGEFYVRPADFLGGHSCPQCANVKRLDRETFIERAREIHGDKYDYSKVEYRNNKTKVCIICPEHGEFWQRPNDHLSGYRCIKCVQKYSPTTEEWIEKARKVHGDRYDYSKVNYVNAFEKVCIVCPEHGEFWQIAANHLTGANCPACNCNKKSVMEETVADTLLENSYKFERQKTFDWLKYRRHMYLDFYLPDLNIAIEVQGDQHFTPIEKFGGQKEHNLQVKRDKTKYDLCVKHGIIVLYVTKKNNDVIKLLEGACNGTANKEQEHKENSPQQPQEQERKEEA